MSRYFALENHQKIGSKLFFNKLSKRHLEKFEEVSQILSFWKYNKSSSLTLIQEGDS